MPIERSLLDGWYFFSSLLRPPYARRFLNLSPRRQRFILANPLLCRFHRRLFSGWLRDLIAGRRVVIVGSGPSALELSSVPEDAVLMTCNAGLRLLADRGIPNRVDLYYYHKRATEWNQSGLEPYVSRVSIGCFISNLVQAIRIGQKYERIRRVQTVFIRDFNRDNFYLEPLLRPSRVRSLSVNGVDWTSAGLRLLQYALYFQAKEIYLIGIDHTSDYFWGMKDRVLIELPFERRVLQILSKNFSHIYSLSPQSPITQYFPHKRI